MGVPALFRWLSRKYPKIISSVVEEDASSFEAPNPNGECDALYLDMNGIVHPCTHPEGRKAPETEEDMMVEVFKYTERVVNMARPRKLLFMAIDGVAPRAKMNQQRSRRFRAAQEARTKEEERLEAIAEWEARGRPMSDAFKTEQAWDSNAITPGTPFMDLLAASLRYWVAKKMNTSPGWQNLQVIISDASVPGEGEHKIMDYIRRLRSQPEHDPNTQHVIYGLDADLIMLSLATHEPFFKVLREDVFFQGNKPRGCHNCGEPGHHSANCTNPPKPKEQPKEGAESKPFIFLDVAVLREYLEIELNLPNLPFAFDLERALDDWVFLIFFVGNDFLPHLPSLEIREGAIDTLMQIWRVELGRMGGYITEHGSVHLDRLQVILDGLASREADIFRKRKEAEDRAEARSAQQQQNRQTANAMAMAAPATTDRPSLPSADKRRKVNNAPETYDSVMAIHANFVPVRTTNIGASLPGRPSNATIERAQELKTSEVKSANLSAAERLKAELLCQDKEGIAVDQPEMTADAETEGSPRGQKRKAEEGTDPAAEELEAAQASDDSGSDEEPPEVLSAIPVKIPQEKALAPLKMLGNNMVEQEDSVKLWEPGYHERYYRQKFGVEPTDEAFKRRIVKAYVEGLCWVLRYYYQGCPSWEWYYPEHFSPFASDFTDLASLDIKFEQGTPFKPCEQLMAVFPADSRKHIPEPLQPLMINEDSPIIDFYPTDFAIDMNGKKMIWQGVALLPFIDQKRLLDAIRPLLPKLSDDEKRRNAPGRDAIFVHEDHPLYSQLSELYQGRPTKEAVPIDWKRSYRLSGQVAADPECVPGSTYFSPLTVEGQPDIDNDRSLGASFYFPEQRVPHRSVLLKGARPPKGRLTSHDYELVKRGVMPDNRPSGGSGFHASRRDIDGIGVRQSHDRNAYPRSGQQQNSQYGGNNRFPQGQSRSYNYQQQQRPYQPPAEPSYQAPVPSFNAGSSYSSAPTYYAPPPSNNYANYGQPPQAPTYQPPVNQFNNTQAMRLPPHLQYLARAPEPGGRSQQPPANFRPSSSQQRNGYVYKR